jgi:hypothetical protein
MDPAAMDLDAVAAETLAHRLAARAPWRPGRPAPEAPGCPGCGGPLEMGPVGPAEPDRHLGICKTLQCGEVVTFRRLERRLIVVERIRRDGRRRP